MDAYTVSLMAQALSLNVIAQGMTAQNVIACKQGRHPPHNEGDFQDVAEQLTAIADKAMEFANALATAPTI